MKLQIHINPTSTLHLESNSFAISCFQISLYLFPVENSQVIFFSARVHANSKNNSWIHCGLSIKIYFCLLLRHNGRWFISGEDALYFSRASRVVGQGPMLLTFFVSFNITGANNVRKNSEIWDEKACFSRVYFYNYTVSRTRWHSIFYNGSYEKPFEAQKRTIARPFSPDYYFGVLWSSRGEKRIISKFIFYLMKIN